MPIFCIFAAQINTLYYMLQLRIKELCKEQGITLNTLAERIGVSQPSISGLATGKQKPSLDTLEKLSQALNVEVGELFAPKNDFIAFVRSEGKTHTITSKEELKEFADSINAPKVYQKEAQETNSETTDTERQ